jgi:uncharacterized protein (DUF305 family)
MNKESILYGVIGILIGAILTGFGAAYAVNNNHQSMMNMMGMHSNTDSRGMMSDSDMSMADMTGSLQGKTGDDFDKAFVSGMIAHHQGAIEMANLAKQNAKHDEIKSLSAEIVTAQTKEINEMKSWQSQWGYGSSDNDSGHNMNDMMGN